MIAVREALTIGNRRSLGKTDEVVESVLADSTLLSALFACAYDADEIVRMRAADGLEKVCRAKPDWLEPYLDQIFEKLVFIEQASVRWHVAQILAQVELSGEQRERAVEFVRGNLKGSGDWLVVICSMEAFAEFARRDEALREECIGVLRERKGDARKAVAKKAAKLLSRLG